MTDNSEIKKKNEPLSKMRNKTGHTLRKNSSESYQDGKIINCYCALCCNRICFSPIYLNRRNKSLNKQKNKDRYKYKLAGNRIIEFI